MRKNSTLSTMVGGVLVFTMLLSMYWFIRPTSTQILTELNQPNQVFIEEMGVTISSEADLGETKMILSKEERIINHQKTIKKVVDIQPQ